MTRLVLHIGGEKTGTTSLQTCFSKNADLLLDACGLLYPTVPQLEFRSAHYPVAAAFLEREQCDFVPADRTYPPEQVFGALSDLVEKKAPEAVVLSAEHFSSRFDGARIEALASLLSHYSVSVVLYVRNQADLLLSAFSTFVASGDRRWLDLDIATLENPYFNYLRVADAWAAGFGASNVQTRSYEDAREDIVGDFLSALGFDKPEGLKDADRLNERLSYQQIRMLHLVNGHLPTWEEALASGRPEDHELAGRTRRHLARAMAGAEGEVPLARLLGAADRTLLHERFSDINARLKSRYGAAPAPPPDVGIEEDGQAELPSDIDVLTTAVVRAGAQLAKKT